MLDMSYVPLTQAILYSCCALFLQADDDMPTGVDATAYSQWLDQSAQALGFTSWVDFYHAYEVPQPIPETPIPGTTLPPEIVE